MKRLSVSILIIFTVVAVCYGAPYPKTPTGMWNFIHNAQEQWIYEPDRSLEPCQAPAISIRSLKGDCDDFAVMIACYLQEYWGYDTFVSLIGMVDSEDHWVAFLWVSKAVFDSVARKCSGYYPYQRVDGRLYISIDWHLCPKWRWVSPGGTVKHYEWYELVGKPI